MVIWKRSNIFKYLHATESVVTQNITETRVECSKDGELSLQVRADYDVP